MPAFYQWISVDEANGVAPGWQIFERGFTTPRGENLPIAWAVTKKIAARITKALNEQEKLNASR
jgi:hypothetical protein